MIQVFFPALLCQDRNEGRGSSFPWGKFQSHLLGSEQVSCLIRYRLCPPSPLLCCLLLESSCPISPYSYLGSKLSSSLPSTSADLQPPPSADVPSVCPHLLVPVPQASLSPAESTSLLYITMLRGGGAALKKLSSPKPFRETGFESEEDAGEAGAS